MKRLAPTAILTFFGAGSALLAVTLSVALASGRIAIESLEDDRLAVSVEEATPLSVLKALSDQVGFDLRLPEAPPAEEPVNLRMIGRIGDLLPRLLPNYNLLLRSNRGEDGQMRLYQVILLEGGAGSGQEPLPTASNPAPVSASSRETRATSQIVGGPTSSRGGIAVPLTPEMLQRAEQQREDILRRLGRSNN